MSHKPKQKQPMSPNTLQSAHFYLSRRPPYVSNSRAPFIFNCPGQLLPGQFRNGSNERPILGSKSCPRRVTHDSLNCVELGARTLDVWCTSSGCRPLRGEAKYHNFANEIAVVICIWCTSRCWRPLRGETNRPNVAKEIAVIVSAWCSSQGCRPLRGETNHPTVSNDFAAIARSRCTARGGRPFHIETNHPCAAKNTCGHRHSLVLRQNTQML